MSWCSVTLLEWTGSGYADGISMDHSNHKDKSREACHSHTMPFPTSRMPPGWFQMMAPRFFKRGGRIFHPEFQKEVSFVPVLATELKHGAALAYYVCWNILQSWQHSMIVLYSSMNSFLLGCCKYSLTCNLHLGWPGLSDISLLVFGMPGSLKPFGIVSHFYNQL